jgi:hypothetical protein
MQAVDLKLLDLEAPDDRSADRQPANRQGADGNSPQGRCPDCGRTKASRCELHRGKPQPSSDRECRGSWLCGAQDHAWNRPMPNVTTPTASSSAAR